MSTCCFTRDDGQGSLMHVVGLDDVTILRISISDICLNSQSSELHPLTGLNTASSLRSSRIFMILFMKKSTKSSAMMSSFAYAGKGLFFTLPMNENRVLNSCLLSCSTVDTLSFRYFHFAVSRCPWYFFFFSLYFCSSSGILVRRNFFSALRNSRFNCKASSVNHSLRFLTVTRLVIIGACLSSVVFSLSL